MRQRLIYLCKFFLVTVVLFIIAKIAFMLVNHEGHSFTVGDMLDVIWHGLSLDFSTALYILIVPFLVSLVSLWWDGKLLTRILHGYYFVLAIVLKLAFVVDTSLYPFWHFKLDATCLQYFDSPAEMRASVSGLYMTVRLIVIIVGVVLVYNLYKRIPLWHKAPAYRSGATAGSVLLIPLFIIGIRGGLSESTTNIGQVYFSQDQFLNHSAVNPVFSFMASLEDYNQYIISYDYYDETQCQELTEGFFPTHSIDPDTLLTTTRPNIVIIIMESCGGQFTDIGGHPEITPRLNRLKQESIDFTQCFANSWRTDKGVVSILSGHPAFPITSLMKLPEKSRSLPSIARSLKQKDYDNTFLYGGDINFTNMRSYVMGSGYDRLVWKNDYSLKDQKSAEWGVRDDIMFDTLFDQIANEQSPHWMKTLLTLSSHEPWDVPTHRLDDPIYNAFNYLDGCIGDFIDRLKKTPQWDDLLVIILPDHGYRYQDIDERTLLFNHIPLIWTGGAIRQPQRIASICNQSDLAATLLGQMQLPHDDFPFSRDVLSKSYTRPFAFHTYVNGVTMIDSTGFMAFDLDSETFTAKEGPDTDRLFQEGKAILQVLSNDLEKR